MTSFSDLDAHSSGRPIALAASPKALFVDIRSLLVTASNEMRIVTSPHHVYTFVRFFSGAQGALAKDLRRNNLEDGAFSITGGQKNQHRSKEVEHFARDDGAWFDFSITGRQVDGQLELLAYDFEIRLSPNCGTPFLRFDLNLPAHANAERDLRCHIHCGSDDILLPAPLMKPTELLTLLIDGIRMPTERKARRLTQFESEWLTQAAQLAAIDRVLEV